MITAVFVFNFVFVFSNMHVYLYPSKFDIGCGVHLTDSWLVLFGALPHSLDQQLTKSIF